MTVTTQKRLEDQRHDDAGQAACGGDEAERHAAARHPPFAEHVEDRVGEHDEAQPVHEPLGGDQRGDRVRERRCQEAQNAQRPARVDELFLVLREALGHAGGERGAQVTHALGQCPDHGDEVGLGGEFRQARVICLEDTKGCREACEARIGVRVFPFNGN